MSIIYGKVYDKTNTSNNISDPLKISSILATTTVEMCARQNLQKEIYNGRVKYSSGYSALNVIDI